MTQFPEAPLPEAILDSIAEGVFTVDRQWRISSFNRAAEQITGVSRGEACGRRCGEVLCASLCGSQCPLRATQRTGRPIVDQPLQIAGRGGHRISVSISAAVLRDREGDAVGGVITFRDLTMAEQLRKPPQPSRVFADIIGRSQSMRRLFQLLPQLAESSSTVLIEGASGTGKELFARAIHNLSPRRDKRFVAVNCSALPDTLLESELFGYKAGAFTDARHDNPGRFAVADGGTIFLDEIGDVSPAMQTKLLRVLQERVFEPLGSVEPVKVNVRVIAATNQDLRELARVGAFREDLYYRVNIVRVELPLLRERREDIPLLVEHFIAKFNRLQGKHVAGVSEEAKAILVAHDYPGNVRELENIIEYAFVLCRGGLIDWQHLPPSLRSQHDLDSLADGRNVTLKDREALHIVETIRRHHGNRTAAARELGIHLSTLFRKIKSMRIDVPDGDGRSRNKTTSASVLGR
jgi:PAS domain S-box-containing protein